MDKLFLLDLYNAKDNALVHICFKVLKFWKFLKIPNKILAVEKISLSSRYFKYCHGPIGKLNNVKIRLIGK